jgi:hypothetical protein
LLAWRSCSGRRGGALDAGKPAAASDSATFRISAENLNMARQAHEETLRLPYARMALAAGISSSVHLTSRNSTAFNAAGDVITVLIS